MNSYKRFAIVAIFPFMEKEVSYLDSLEIKQFNVNDLETYLEKYAYWEEDSRGNSLGGCVIQGFDQKGKILFDQNPGPNYPEFSLGEILFKLGEMLSSVKYILINEYEDNEGSKGTLLVLNDEIRLKIKLYLAKQLEKEVKEITKELD